MYSDIDDDASCDDEFLLIVKIEYIMVIIVNSDMKIKVATDMEMMERMDVIIMTEEVSIAGDNSSKQK